jgi:hypothetical protein
MRSTTGGINMALDLTDDVIDLRDIIERFEEVEAGLLACFNEQQEIEGDDTTTDDPEDSAFQEWTKQTKHEDADEYRELQAILEELKGCGGDEQWRGDWYPITLISERYFTDYCQQELEDCGMIPRDLPSFVHIDWERTAGEMRYDYSYTSIGENDYLYR